jgi:type IV pilus assembly protein PilP
MNLATLRFSAGLMFCLLIVSGCSPAVDDGMAAWIQAERQAAQPLVQPLPVPTGFTPQLYETEGLGDPFGSERLTSGLRGSAVSSPGDSTGGVIESKRRRQPLEAFALERMTLVGTLSREGQRAALVKVGQQLYQVQAGDYLGQHHGRVQRITEHHIELRERVLDANGQWIARSVALPLQEESRP